MWPATHRASANALHERIGATPLECCGERKCVCPVEPATPQPFRIRVEKLTKNGFIGEDLAHEPFWAVDAMTAAKNAREVFGFLRPVKDGWMFLAIPVRS